MQKLSFLLPVAISTLFVILSSSCSEKNKAEGTIKQMEESLINSSKTINLSTEMTLKELENKTTDPLTAERAKVWYPKAEQVARLTTETYKYLETAKTRLIEGSISVDSITKKVISYKEDVLNTDSSIALEFKNSFGFINLAIKKMNSQMLTTLQNNFKIIENKIIVFCNLKIGSLDGISMFSSYSAIISQNSNYLKSGDILEIRAGVGSYSKAAMPEVKIQGKKINIGEEGYALFKTKAASIPGIHRIPVEISFFNQERGKDELRVFNIEYTVVKPCDK